MMTPTTAEEDLEHIESTLKRLFKIAVESLRKVEEALEKNRPIDLSANTILAEHMKDIIYGETLFFIAKWQPLGHTLIHAETMIKVSYDLFRITRYANEMAKTFSLSPQERIDPVVIETIRIAREMVEKAFEAFISQNKEIAKTLENLDEKIDEAYRKKLSEIAQQEMVPRADALACIMLRQIERVADHATYIAREVLRSITFT